MEPSPSTLPPIAVLMATYNGARYLQEQLDSLWRQSRQDFQLLVRDDGSTDETISILQRAAEQQPGRVHIVRDDLGRLGPKGSFGTLLGHAKARWIAFCDQDDCWLPHKLAAQASTLEAMEAELGTGTPLLCCSDAAVTDADLSVVAPSYFARHRISVANGRDLPLQRLLFRNYAIGATTMVNAALVERCRKMPDEAIMHDWWCALVATACGHSAVLPQALMLYRQHGRNSVGSRRRGLPRSIGEFQEYLRWARANSARSVQQACALRREIATWGSPVDAAVARVLGGYEDFARQSPTQRMLTVVRLRSFKPGFALNGLHLYACVTAPL